MSTAAAPGAAAVGFAAVPLVDDVQVPVALHPAPGVVCAAEMPGLDGYTLTITPTRSPGDDGLGFASFDFLGVTHNDRELTGALIDDGVRAELTCLHRVHRVLALTGAHVIIAGDPLDAGNLAAVVSAVTRLCSRPFRLARRVERFYRRFGGVASGARWNTVDYHVALGTSPPVRVDWPRLPGHGLVTRLHVETTSRDDGFELVDTTRMAPPPGVAVPLATSGRYVCVAATLSAVESACARVDPALVHLSSALPHLVRVTPSGVDVLFPGYEEQLAAIEPAVTLARVLAGPAAYAPGPYR
jgi:hypothetical protein